MYPDLSYLISDFFGTPVDNLFSLGKTFGLFLAIAFACAAYLLKIELKRKEEEGLISARKITRTEGGGINIFPILTNVVFGFIAGYKLPLVFMDFEACKTDAASVLFSTQGYMTYGIIGAVILGAYALYQVWDEKSGPKVRVTETVHPHERVMDITFMAALFGILGAKLFVIIESKEAFSAFLANPLEQLLSGSGLTIYGGLILAFIAVYIYVKKIGIPPIHVMDAVAPALIIGYGVGRMGCQFSGDGDWGIINTLAQPSWWFLPDWMWSYDYPNTVLEYYNHEGNSLVPIADCSGYETAEGLRPRYCNKLKFGVFPTPIYETIMSFIIFGILWALRRKFKVAGMLFFVYLILNGVERFFIEKIRVNETFELFGFHVSQAEIISTLLVVIGLVGFFYLRTKKPTKKINN